MHMYMCMNMFAGGGGLGGMGCKSVHCTCTHAGCYAIVFRCSTCTHARCYAIMFCCCGEGGGGGVVRTCIALAHMLDVTP